MTAPCPVPPLGFPLRSSNPDYRVQDLGGNRVDINRRDGLIGDQAVLHEIAKPVEQNAPVIAEWFVEAFTGTLALGISFDGKSELIGADILNFYYVNDGRIIVNGAVYTNAPVFGVGDWIGMYYVGVEGLGAFYRNGLRVA